MFRDDFVWGVASSAYQVEGRSRDFGSGKTIWDTFTEEGHILDGYTAEDGADHINHYKEDYALMRELGVKAYRFSLNWTRILPNGTGEVNREAIVLYRDMIEEMKKNGITPYLTMYHWEFPQALQDRGGWVNEDVVEWFGEYAKVVAENFSDICEHFITLNEPQCFVGLGHLSGVHAPGQRLPYKEVFQIAHNALRAHGLAVKQLRKYACRPIQIGYAPTCGVAYPATDKPEDIAAAREYYFTQNNPMDNWTWNVAWFSDPVFLGHYPEDGLKKYKEYLPEITAEDMELISQPLDFMGQNIYNGFMIRAGADGKPEFVERPAGFPKTAAQWPVTPECLYWGLKFLYERYRLPLYVTENGMSCHDNIARDGRVHDEDRITFLDRYISAVQKVVDEGADIRGYFLWTFLDNFEWDKGYTERFGIVYVDFQTKERIPKDSAYWYKEVMESNGRTLSINKDRELFVAPEHNNLQYMGRIDFDKCAGPEFVYPCTFVKIRFRGTDCRVELSNTKSYWNNYMGYILDGVQDKFRLKDEPGRTSYVLAEGLADEEHEIMLFKRQDSCHTVQFHGFYLNTGAKVLELSPLPMRKIEVYGDSVSAGEVSEAVGYEGQPDPQHDGSLSNSWYSYSWTLARRLDAQIHDIAQGGICLLDDAGWFAGPDCKGMLSMYDKIEYHPDFGVQKRWDFTKYTPDVVVVAIGQNDKDPVDYMTEDYNSEQSLYWRLAYKDFIGKLRHRYPEAHIILTTTILNHEASWDKAIDEVCQKLRQTDEKIHHFLYTNNGCGTHGHIRISEAEKMAEELAAFIEVNHMFR